jgi:hypothetical protein
MDMAKLLGRLEFVQARTQQGVSVAPLGTRFVAILSRGSGNAVTKQAWNQSGFDQKSESAPTWTALVASPAFLSGIGFAPV